MIGDADDTITKSDNDAKASERIRSCERVAQSTRIKQLSTLPFLPPINEVLANIISHKPPAAILVTQISHVFVQCVALGRILLKGNDLFNADGGLDGNLDRVLSTIPGFLDLLSHILGVRGEVQIRLLVSSLVHEGKFTVFFANVDDFPVGTIDNGDGSTVRRGDHILVLLSGENVRGEKVTLGVTVLSRLGDGNGKDLAGLALDHHEAVVWRKEGRIIVEIRGWRAN